MNDVDNICHLDEGNRMDGRYHIGEWYGTENGYLVLWYDMDEHPKIFQQAVHFILSISSKLTFTSNRIIISPR